MSNLLVILIIFDVFWGITMYVGSVRTLALVKAIEKTNSQHALDLPYPRHDTWQKEGFLFSMS